MKKYSFSLFVLFIVLGLVSCDSYLDIKPKNRVLLKKTKDYELLLNYYGNVKTIGVYSVFLTDETFFPDADNIGGMSLNSRNLTIQRFYKLEEELYTPAEQDRDWDDCYECIYNFNVIIEGVLDSEEGSPIEKEQLYGEALLARAFQYYQLLVLYAKPYNQGTAAQDLGVPLILHADINQDDLIRASIQEMCEQIEGDLLEALPYLPKRPTLNAYRGSKAAAHSLLARLFLYQGEYKEAMEQAEAALKSKPELIDLNQYEVVNQNTNSGRNNVPEYTENPEALYIKITTFVATMSARAYVNPELVNLFDQENDCRFKLFITNDYRNKQYDYFLWLQGLDANIGIATPELYLTAAECHARLGDMDKAMDRLEALRVNRYANYTPIPRSNLTQKEVIKLVLDERRKELMMIPALRLADLKRLGADPDFSQPVVRTIDGTRTVIQPTSNRLVLQIPHVVMEFNPRMVQNNRND